ncbi:glycoside hydrolase domain-containing protein [Anaerococcus sp. AGMB09787]|uniref:glycoside hydrolase domain-containing protein n=1 Tax=Anaerococcus sp. AGMB09787 TaxID=2922869 RepID=UPI001FAE79BE|nr:glycoside hydrolase domain-containing protein [Anaerococcus sp. AGMB09787]
MSFKYKLVDSNLLYTDITDEKFKNIKEKNDYQMWKNDFTLIQILVISEEDDVFELEVEQIKDFEFEIYNFKKNLAYIGKTFEPIELYTKENRTIATDLLLKENKIKLSRGETNSFIISVKTNKEISPTKHQIHFKLNSLNNRNEKFENKFTIEVKDKKVEKLQSFDLQLWQYPYSVSEYYGLKPFSEEHIDILKNHLSIYKKLGADAIVASICEDAWDGQTYSKNEIHYPSMIKWSMNNGKMNYSYEDFDKWIKLNEEISFNSSKTIL